MVRSILLIAILSFKLYASDNSLFFKQTIHNCFINIDRARALETINPHLNSYKEKLKNFVKGYSIFLTKEFKEDFMIFASIGVNQVNDNTFVVDSIVNDFENIMKMKLDRGEATSLAGYFSRQLRQIKKNFKTDTLTTKTYKAKNGQTYTLPIFYTNDGAKIHPVMRKLIGQYTSSQDVANDIVNYSSQAKNIHFLPLKTIPLSMINGQVYNFELRELVKAFYSPYRDRVSFMETCRKLGF